MTDTVFRVGDRVCGRRTGREATVTHIDLDGWLHLDDANCGPSRLYDLVKRTGPTPTSDDLTTRVDALEARAARHVWHLTRVLGLVDALAGRVTALEARVRDLETRGA